jgi:hypothetical protein
MSTPKVAYAPGLLASIDRILSRERLTRYLAASNGDLPLALRLYEQNIAVSEGLFGFLHGLEITVRNSIHFTLAPIHGTNWYEGTGSLRWPEFSTPIQQIISKARSKAGSRATPGKVLAEMSFGIWPDLVGGKYLHRLWIPCLHRAFPNAGVHRKVVHRRLETIRRLRNRIAHHERILTSQNLVYTGFPVQPCMDIREILECVQWVSADAADWLHAHSRFDRVQKILVDVSKAGMTL